MDLRERMTLTIAGATYARSGRRDDDFTLLVGHTPTRAWQIVDNLIDRADAEAEMPETVHRLKNLRAARQRARWYSRRIEHMPYSRSM